MGRQHIDAVTTRLVPFSVIFVFALLGAIVILALGCAFMQSLHISTVNHGIDHGSHHINHGAHNIGAVFASYKQILTDTTFYLSFGITLLVSIIITAVSTVVGVGIALFIRNYATHAYWLRLVYQIPIAIPHIVIALFCLLFFAQSGFLSRLLYHVNIVDAPSQFPPLTNDRLFFGIIFSYCTKEIPFMVLVALSALQSIDNNLEQVATSLGATASTAIRRVIIPLLLPTLAPIIAVIFAFVFGSYEIPSLLGRSHPSFIPVLLYRYYKNPDILYRSNALALSIIVTAFALVVSFVFLKMCNRHKIVYSAH